MGKRDEESNSFWNRYSAFTVCSYAASTFNDFEFGTYDRTECDVTDPFYDDTCPTCTLIIIPRILGRLIGDKEVTRTFFILSPQGAEFDDSTVVKWESDSIEVVSRHIFFKRLMIMKVKINGSGFEKDV